MNSSQIAPPSRFSVVGGPPKGPQSSENSGAAGAPPPNPEVVAQATRRRFTAAYKLKIVQEADACTEPGQIGALLRREGLFSSHLTTWRRLAQKATLQGLTPKKRGRKEVRSPETAELERLRRENQHLRTDLHKANLIIDVQKKVSELLGLVPQKRNGHS
jgi:transposase